MPHIKGPKMNKERLLRLASRLDKVLPEHFNPCHWYLYDPGEHSIEETKVISFKSHDFDCEEAVILKEGFCGSTACVLGHAGLIKEFNDAGLYVTTAGNVIFKNDAGQVNRGSSAGSEFFDIPYRHAEAMFYTGIGSDTFYGKPEDEVKPEDVAVAIRRYVKTDGECMEEAIIQETAEL